MAVLSAEQEEFLRQCEELGDEIKTILLSYPKSVAVCVLPATLAAISIVLEIKRDEFVAMFDSALAVMRDGPLKDD